MGQAKLKQRSAFSEQQIEEWESDDCVNFAVALARLTSWLIHVDWWSSSPERREDISINELKPLRVYVADNGDRIFDVRGNKSIFEFNDKIIRGLAIKKSNGHGGVYTRFYDEGMLSNLPLRIQPNETKIAHAISEIQKNRHFITAITVRKQPKIPAYQAAHFTYGRCSAYAEAIQEIIGLEPIALLATRFSPLYEGTQQSTRGYFHSVVLHPDGMAEDAWGKTTLSEIASRFGVIEYEVSRDEHRVVVNNLLHNSRDRYLEALQEARDLINKYRVKI